MKNSIRCCISCILPCGALDVIRIVHSNGYVEEISGSIKACDVMKAHPKHVLKRPSSSPAAADHDSSAALPKIVVVPPEAQLQRGKIYFLMPLPPNPRSRTSTARRNKVKNNNPDNNINNNSQRNGAVPDNAISMTNLLLSDQYLTEILSEKASTHRERRRGRVGVWRPHLESICESPTATATHLSN